ncbi:DUF803-domain-containing protein [Gigaspora margarita]|uniref:DUF803-domain-containing protein n=1 Tax=Gigaspora margarita TaxID=4874 RepID=A0A8H3XJ60_GIGMA|nr:DUF803-domain-containing protein [Gigaspora margarita]
MVGDRDKYIGLTLAVSSSLLIGTSFIITKKGLIDATRRHGPSSEDHSYLRNPIWWAGMSTMVIGELLNFAAYSFAPAILVTPLGALSVLIGAVLASLILKENLGRIGTVGCGLCLIGSINIVIHAPADRDIVTVDEILDLALHPAFLLYCVLVASYTIFAISRVVPKYGKKNPLVYLSICSLVGSISVMSCKGFGIALKLTFAGNNQFTHPSTYVFIIISGLCILVQMNYFNKALDQFETNIVNPIYYVFFTTSTIFASVLLFQGFNTSNAVNVISLFCGFLTIFAGVFLLNVAKTDGLLTRSSQNGNGALRSSMSLDVHDMMKTRDATLLNAFNEESLGLTQLNDISDSEEG